MTQKTSPLLPLIEALAFAAFAGWFIWRLQEASRYAWMAFPIWLMASFAANQDTPRSLGWRADNLWNATRSEEHTSELQSLRHLVCRLLLEKKNVNPAVLEFVDGLHKAYTTLLDQVQELLT